MNPHAARIRTAIIVAALAVLGAAFASSAAAKVRTGPAGLAFYHPPKHLPRGHGRLIWARKAGGLVPLAKAASTKLVLYTSVTPKGKPVAVSGSVSVPKGKPPKGGWPVISYAHGDHRYRRRLRSFPQPQGRPGERLHLLHRPRVERLAEGRLRGRSEPTTRGSGRPGPIRT